MSPRESNEAMGAGTESVSGAVVDMRDVAFSSKRPPPDMRLRRVIDGSKRALRFWGACCPCEPVQTATPPTGPWRAPRKFAEAGQNSVRGKMTDGTAKVK